MAPHHQPGRPTEQPRQGGPPRGQPESMPPTQPPGGGQPRKAQQPEPISEMDVSTPTLQRVTIGHPQERVPIGPDDYVLNSIYNHQMNTWEVLVLLQPREPESEEGDEE